MKSLKEKSEPTLDRHALEKSEKGNLFDLQGHKNLLVSFGGMHQGTRKPMFEFYRCLSTIECDKIFLREPNQAWYQKGVDSRIDHIDKLIEYLKKVITDQEYERICFLGNSMGGYAAILFGTLLNIDTVIAFAPQTFIDRINRIKYYDHRWKEEIAAMRLYPLKKTEYFDLKAQLAKVGDFKTSIKVYYDPGDRLDRKHAERLKSFPQVELRPEAEGGHLLVKYIRDKGELNAIIQSSFQ